MYMFYDAIYVKFWKIQTNLNDRKQIGDWLGIEELAKGRQGGITQEDSFRVMEIFIFLIVVIVSRLHKYVETYHIAHCKYVQFIRG